MEVPGLDATILTDVQRQALHAAVVLLIDDAFESLRVDGSLEESSIASYLPPRFRHRYTELTFRGLLVALIEVGGRLARTDTPQLRCLAEVLALHIVVEHADVWFESQGHPLPSWGDYEDLAFEDADFELLYQPEWDGIEDPPSEVARSLGMVNLHPDDWFSPFRQDEPVHPYLADGAS